MCGGTKTGEVGLVITVLTGTVCYQPTTPQAFIHAGQFHARTACTLPAATRSDSSPLPVSCSRHPHKHVNTVHTQA